MTKDTYVLGINYRPLGENDLGHNPSAALLKNGHILAMCQEERFTRVKEAPGQFPVQAIRFCLSRAGISINEVAAIGWNWDPQRSNQRAARRRGALGRVAGQVVPWALRKWPLRSLQGLFSSSLFPEKLVQTLQKQLLYWHGLSPSVPVFCFDHHLAHAASAFFPSGFDRSTVLTWDCWGDHLSGLVALGDGQSLAVVHEYPFADFSIGLLNEFVFDFLRTSEKGNLMGLAPYGKPAGLLQDLVEPERLRMRMDRLGLRAPFPAEFLARAGAPRRLGDPLEQRHKNLTADLQQVIERFGTEMVREAVRVTGSRDVCFAGGCALNATFNGKIGLTGLVDRIFVQPEAGDAGGALGAAYLAYQKLGHTIPKQTMNHAYWGPSFTLDDIREQIETVGVGYEQVSDDDLPQLLSEALAKQQIVGWFQLGSEWGPRALGARSIMADPRTEAIRDRVNLAIKYRDWWRPFAPSMLAESAETYLETWFHSPFMITTFPVRPEKRAEIAGVVHCDGTTRPQMVEREINPRYYDTIKAFGQRTGVPMVLNTSFNLKGEPLVNSPRDALRTFYSSGLDLLVMGNVVIRKSDSRHESN